jgi:prepilin-type N-terminal cleavage/methylation domain-containing protein
MPFRAPRPRSRDAGFSLVEVLLSVVLLGVMVLGTVTLLVAQSRQLAQDKILLDMQDYASALLDEASLSGAHACLVQPGLITGSSFTEVLEFRRVGYVNRGRTVESRFLRNGERNVELFRANRRLSLGGGFPPPELDPRRGHGQRRRVVVKDFQVRFFQPAEVPLPPQLWRNLVEIEVELEMWDRETGLRLSRSYSRRVATPNHMLFSRMWPWELEGDMVSSSAGIEAAHIGRRETS